MNNKEGFILSTYVYMLLVFFLLLLTTMLAVMNNTKLLSNKLKEQTNNTSGLVDKNFSFVLHGDGDIIIKKGEEYVEPGFKIQTSKKQDLSNIVKIKGNVDINIPNTYKLTYIATYNGITKKLTRNVHVLDNIASNYITELYNHRKDENGLIKDNTVDENIRYVGASPNNKVYFNCDDTDGTNPYGSENYNYQSSCELWRIIGVFNTKSTYSATETPVTRIKIVRDKVLSTYMEWDAASDGINDVNQWGETTLTSDNTTVYPGASLKQYLNDGEESYYNSLSSIAKAQISDALWYTGAVIRDKKEGIYVSERGDQTGKSTEVNYTTKWLGKIGLIYLSDWAYAGVNCGDVVIGEYKKNCGLTTNWLIINGGDYWTITSRSDLSNYSNHVKDGTIYYNVVNGIRGVRPALYLLANVKIISGDGTDESPYKLSI